MRVPPRQLNPRVRCPKSLTTFGFSTVRPLESRSSRTRAAEDPSRVKSNRMPRARLRAYTELKPAEVAHASGAAAGRADGLSSWAGAGSVTL